MNEATVTLKAITATFVYMIDVTSPLFLHPSKESNSLRVNELEGASNYRTWRRSMEVALTSKIIMGFVTGDEKKDTTDPVKVDVWDTYNSIVIS
ncbi:putative aminotransferase YodT [Bienertia sinuspersici]